MVKESWQKSTTSNDLNKNGSQKNCSEVSAVIRQRRRMMKRQGGRNGRTRKERETEKVKGGKKLYSNTIRER